MLQVNTTSLIGKRFGTLTVLSYGILKKRADNKGARSYWLCLCDCGKEKLIRDYSLKSGNTTSCGCKRGRTISEKLSLAPGIAAFNHLYAIYKVQAISRGYRFKLSKRFFKDLISKNCVYCNSRPNNLHKPTSLKYGFRSNGIDRINNLKGYTV